MSTGKRSKKDSGKTRWSKEEDSLLTRLVKAAQNSGNNLDEMWVYIATQMPGRDELQCANRWNTMLDPSLIKGPWTKEEDDLMIQLVGRYGAKNWSMIAEHLKGRIGKQCRERWHNNLNPELNKGPWTDEEMRIIEEAHARLGNKVRTHIHAHTHAHSFVVQSSFINSCIDTIVVDTLLYAIFYTHTSPHTPFPLSYFPSPVGRDCQVAARTHRQSHQKPLELNARAA